MIIAMSHKIPTIEAAAMTSLSLQRWDGGQPLRLAKSLSSIQDKNMCKISGIMNPRSRNICEKKNYGKNL